MKLLFEFNIEKKKIVFFGDGFEISSPAETYEDIAEFAKDVIENDIAIPKLKQRTTNQKLEKGQWKWIDLHGDGFETLCCSECGYTGGREDYNFCPSCGKPMI